MEGREAGSPGARLAAAYIANAFEACSLTQMYSGNYFHDFEAVLDSQTAEPALLRNVLGIVDPDRDGPVLVIGAHYDHLGIREGALYPGADDNASGVAILIETARAYADSNPHEGPVLFAAFTGEELGLLGSRSYVADQPLPLDRTAGMINVDMVGRLGENPLLFALVGLSDERRQEFVDALGDDPPVREMRSGYEAGDLTPFAEARVPVFYLFTGPHGDYHRPGDVEEKIDYDGLARVGRFLARAAPSFAHAASGGWSGPDFGSHTPNGGRSERPFLGTVPDFTDAGGNGVLVADVVDGSPADRAGIQAGDRIIAIDGEAIDDLRGYAAVLRARAPGDGIEITVDRGGERPTFAATLERKNASTQSGHPGHPGGHGNVHPGEKHPGSSPPR